MKSLAFISCLLLLQINTIRAQQLCMELRTDDAAIIKDLVEKDGIYYLTVDVVQLIEDDTSVGISVKNENPKLRTFLIDPDTEWDFCEPVQASIKEAYYDVFHGYTCPTNSNQVLTYNAERWYYYM